MGRKYDNMKIVNMKGVDSMKKYILVGSGILLGGALVAGITIGAIKYFKGKKAEKEEEKDAELEIDFSGEDEEIDDLPTPNEVSEAMEEMATSVHQDI